MAKCPIFSAEVKFQTLARAYLLSEFYISSQVLSYRDGISMYLTTVLVGECILEVYTGKGFKLTKDIAKI